MALRRDNDLLQSFRHLWTLPTKAAGTLRPAVRGRAFARILGGRHRECAYLPGF